jgi:isoleucyl-tRNA synthetase
VRRSRQRFKEIGEDKNQASYTLKLVLLDFAKSIAPILPFTAEFVFEKVKNKNNEESVHLELWPVKNGKITDKSLEEKMDEVRKIVSLALAERVANAIKVRQPLVSLKIKNQASKIKNEEKLLELIKDEVNIKEIIFDNKIEKEIELDKNITEELRAEGIEREIIRSLKDIRKELSLTSNFMVNIGGTNFALPADSKEEIKKEVSVENFVISEPTEDADVKKEIIIDGKKYWVFVKK